MPMSKSPVPMGDGTKSPGERGGPKPKGTGNMGTSKGKSNPGMHGGSSSAIPAGRSRTNKGRNRVGSGRPQAF